MDFIRRNVNNTTTSTSGGGGGGWNNTGGSFDMSQWFYKDEEGNIHVPVNFIGDYNISAFGRAESGEAGGGSVAVVDNLNSDSTTEALSANQGRILNEKIDSMGSRLPNESVIIGITAEQVSMLIKLCQYVSFDADGNVTFAGNIISNKNITAYGNN